MLIILSLISLIILFLSLDTTGKILNHYLKIDKGLNLSLGFIGILTAYFILSVVMIVLSVPMGVVFYFYYILLFAIFGLGFYLRKEIDFLKLSFPKRYLIVTLIGYLGFVFFNSIEVDGLERFDIVFYYPLISMTFDPSLAYVPFGRILAEIPVIVNSLGDASLYAFQSYYYVLGFFHKMSPLPSVAFVHYIFSFVYLFIICELLYLFASKIKDRMVTAPIIALLLIAYMTNPITTMYYFLGSQYVIFIFALLYYALIKLDKTSFKIGLIWGLAFFSTVSSALFLMPLVLVVLLLVMVLENQKNHLPFIYGISLATYVGMLCMLIVRESYLLLFALTIFILAVLFFAKWILKFEVKYRYAQIIYLLLAFSTLVVRIMFAQRRLTYIDAILWFLLFLYVIFRKQKSNFVINVLFVHYFTLGNMPLIQYIASLRFEFDVLQRTFFFSPGHEFYQILIVFILVVLIFEEQFKYLIYTFIYLFLSLGFIQNMRFNFNFLHTTLNENTHPLYFQDRTRVDIIKQLDAYDKSIEKRIAAPFRARLISTNNHVVFTRDWIDWTHRFVYEDLYLLDVVQNGDKTIEYLLENSDYIIIEHSRLKVFEQLNQFEVILSNEEFVVLKVR